MRTRSAKSLNEFHEAVSEYCSKMAREILASDQETAVKILRESADTNIEDLVLWEWREAKRFEDLIPLVFEFGRENGFWKQVLLDMRLAGEIELAMRFLEKLYQSELDDLRAYVEKSVEVDPSPYLISHMEWKRGRVMEVLMEMWFIVCNKPENEIDEKKCSIVSKRIKRVSKWGRE